MQTKKTDSAETDDKTKLPKGVIQLYQGFLRDPSDPYAEIAGKLINENSPDLVTMWRSLEHRKHPDDPNYEYVWSFLSDAYQACSLPPYHYKSEKEREELAKDINKLTKDLSRLLVVNALDAHLIHSNGINFNGFYYYEDFGESNQACLDTANTNKLKMSEILTGIADRSQKIILTDIAKGKKGKNAEAIRFIRLINTRNKQWYGYPLNAVTAAATNAIFGTNYNESDVANLINR